MYKNQLQYNQKITKLVSVSLYLGRESEDPNPPGPGDLPLGSSLGGGGGPRRLGPVPKMLVFGFRPVEGLLPRSCLGLDWNLECFLNNL